MSRRNLPDPQRFKGVRRNDIEIVAPLSGTNSGKNGLVLEAVHTIAGHSHPILVKCVPQANLRQGWDAEVKKPLLLPQSVRVVRPLDVWSHVFPGDPESFVFIAMPRINGSNLREYTATHERRLSYVFCIRLARALLDFLQAMHTVGVQHGDIHAGNIIVEHPDDSYIEHTEHFWLTDFGIGNSINDLQPKDDFVESGRVVRDVVGHAFPNALDGDARYALDQLLETICPRLEETNPAADGYRTPRAWSTQLDRIEDGRPVATSGAAVSLSTPFDYMSCEQIGDQYLLLQRLFSLSFPNCPDFLELQNTVLTGPRGCGKTMILRSLATKAQILGGRTSGLERVGVYYHCNDLWYAFPNPTRISASVLDDVSVHYFNLSVLQELLGTLQLLEESDTPLRVSTSQAQQVAHLISGLVAGLDSAAPPDTVLSDLRAKVGTLRRDTKEAVAERRPVTTPLLGLSFLEELISGIRERAPQLRVPILVFLDDYSTPRVGSAVQASLNRVIFQRSAHLFFKVATESITTLHPVDSVGKLLEVEREYSVIDLGSSFMAADHDAKRRFIEEVINTRFDASERYDMPRVASLLGDDPINNNEIARRIRGDGHKYSGLATVVDMCSGDMTHTLRLVRDMVAASGGLDRFRRPVTSVADVPIGVELQNKAIEKLGADFLSTIKSAPQHGERICEIVEAFGELANWELKNIDSPNEASRPPKQAFRIEIREALRFGDDDRDVQEIYSTLLRYGVFIRDVTGKSLRSHVVPRLYLRRLLIPLFRLTFSKRDNLGMEADEFKLLLRDPRRFVETRKKARPDEPKNLKLFEDLPKRKEVAREGDRGCRSRDDG